MRNVILMFTTIIATAWCQTNERSGAVSFLVVGESGKTLLGWKVSSFKANDREVAPMFTGLTGTQIPTGFYRYALTGNPVSRGSLASDWTPTLSGQIEVFRKEKFVVRTATQDVLSGIAIDRALPISFVIRGKIEPMPPHSENADPVRIHIHHLNPWSDVDVRVDPSGDFRIYEAPRGLCVLTVIRGAEVLHVEPVFFGQDSRSASFVLRIADKPLSVIRVQ